MTDDKAAYRVESMHDNEIDFLDAMNRMQMEKDAPPPVPIVARLMREMQPLQSRLVEQELGRALTAASGGPSEMATAVGALQAALAIAAANLLVSGVHTISINLAAGDQDFQRTLLKHARQMFLQNFDGGAEMAVTKHSKG